MKRETRPAPQRLQTRAGLVALGLFLSGSLTAVNAWSLQNGLARTPPMGWNSYNKFGGNVTEAQVKAIADAFVSDGLLAAGYQYIVVDYCWMQSRNSSGQMIPSGQKFPDGMKALGDYIHTKGLKFGMYQSPTKVTCCGESGSYQHETSDAAQFASWGVDYLKYDWCGVQSKENGNVTVADVEGRYTAMRDAITASGRPMVYAMCEKGQGTKLQPATWSEPVGNMWRTGNDIAATWARVLTAFDVDLNLAQYAKPGGWNDPDMLEVGNGSLTESENRAHFSLWAIVSAPLMLGNDPSSMSASVKAILTNAEVIAVDQDPLGKQGQRVAMSGQTEVWSKPMADGSVAVVLFNRGGASASITVNWSAIGISGSAQVRDLWAHADKGATMTSYSAMVASHDVAALRIYPPGVTPGTGAGGAGSVGGSGGGNAAGGSDTTSGGSDSSASAGGGVAGSPAVVAVGGLDGGAATAGTDSPVSSGGAVSNGGTSELGGNPASTVSTGGSGTSGSGNSADSTGKSAASGCSCNVVGRGDERRGLFGLLGLAALAVATRRTWKRELSVRER